jgi:hypothetical protein
VLKKFIRALFLEQLVALYRDRNAMLHVLKFVCLLSAAKLLGQGTASVLSS